MTDQRIFPFFVNGQFWKRIEVEAKHIKQGYYHLPVVSRDFVVDGPMSQVVCREALFHLASIMAEAKGSYRAEFFTGFWVIDPNLELEDVSLYCRAVE